MNIVVIDGQGGRMGCHVIEGVRAAKLPVSLIAVGTNALATAAMLKAGAERGATYSLLIGFCLMLIFDVLLG